MSGRWIGGTVCLSVLAVSGFGASEARADEGDMALDLGGMTLETRKITHGVFVQGSPTTRQDTRKTRTPLAR
jgi:hypothetical protein